MGDTAKFEFDGKSVDLPLLRGTDGPPVVDIRKLYPNVDFYSGITLRALGFPAEMFTVLFALARTVGWIAQWKEMIEDPSQKIGRPRQIYTGAPLRSYVAIDKR